MFSRHKRDDDTTTKNEAGEEKEANDVVEELSDLNFVPPIISLHGFYFNYVLMM